jgi:DNA-directed RNA polymerase specialized sigma24 family protein
VPRVVSSIDREIGGEGSTTTFADTMDGGMTGEYGYKGSYASGTRAPAPNPESPTEGGVVADFEDGDLLAAVAGLSQLQADIVQLAFLEEPPMSATAIARRLHVRPAVVHREKAAALAALRQSESLAAAL